jgi:hypothetical protein
MSTMVHRASRLSTNRPLAWTHTTGSEMAKNAKMSERVSAARHRATLFRS